MYKLEKDGWEKTAKPLDSKLSSAEKQVASPEQVKEAATEVAEMMELTELTSIVEENKRLRERLDGAKRLLARYHYYLNAKGNWIRSCAALAAEGEKEQEP